MQEPNAQFAMPYPPGATPNPGMMYPPPPPRPNQNQYPTYPTPTTQTGALQSNEIEESYIENILRLNRGKFGTFHFTYSDSLEWRDRVYQGVIEAAGRDHIIISNPKDGKRYILLNVYLDWVEFNEEINYEYPIR